MPIEGLEPWPALVLEGRDVYIREGCHVCHTQMVRPFRAETERYGHYSVAGEHVYEHPFLWGSKRTGPDLARVGERYSDAWHLAHLYNPRDVVPESNMPAFPWLFEKQLDGKDTAAKMKALRLVGVPYTDDDITGAQQAVVGSSEADAVVAYLQQLGPSTEAEAIIMDQGTLQGIGTILAMLGFGGVCWWAFSGHKKKDFEDAANLPFVKVVSWLKRMKSRGRKSYEHLLEYLGNRHHSGDHDWFRVVTLGQSTCRS